MRAPLLPASRQAKPRRRLRMHLALSVAYAAASASPAAAATVTANATITATIIPVCRLDAPPTLAFGTLAGGQVLASAKVATGQIVVTCSSGATYSVSLGDGLSPQSGAGGSRQMQAATSSSALIPYQLYSNGGHTAVWNSANQVSSTGTGAGQSFTVDGVIAAGTTISAYPGEYGDTVAVSVVY